MFEVKCEDPILKHVLEEKLKAEPEAFDGQIEKFYRDVQESLKTLPYARTLLEQRRYSDLYAYFDELDKEFAEDKRLENALKFCDKINSMLEAHMKNAPAIRNIPTRSDLERYSEWQREKGRLEGWHQAAHADCMALEKSFLEPAKKQFAAIKVLQEHLHDHIIVMEKGIVEIRAEIEKIMNEALANEDPRIRPLMKRICEAYLRGEQTISFDVVNRRTGEQGAYSVATSYFFKE